MPVISPVGRKSLEGRLTILAIYVVLCLGAVTMIVPFLLTLTASVSNAYDLEKHRLLPRYLWDDDELYCKFLVEKYPSTYFRRLKSSHRLVGVSDARQLMRAGDPADVLPEIRAFHAGPRPDYDRIRADYHAFIADYPAHKLTTPHFIYVIQDRWRLWLRDRYVARARREGLIGPDDDPQQVALELMNRHYGETVAASFDTAAFPEGEGFAPKLYWRHERQAADYQQFLAEQEVATIQPQRGDLQYTWFLTRRYGLIDRLNAAWDTDHQDFVQIVLPRDPPAHPGQRRDWRLFRQRGVKLSWVEVPASHAGAFRSFLRQQTASLAVLSARLGEKFTRWDQVPFTTRYEGSRAYRGYWSAFVLEHVPVEDRSISYFELEYADHLRAKYTTAAALAAAYRMPVADLENFRLPYAGLDYSDFHRHRGSWRWHFLTNNFVLVFDFIATKGRALWNTLILVGLTILGGLTINPIAAFALSRYHVPGLAAILLVLLIPMAFPPEVSMIPSFLLLREFPILVVATVIAAAAALLTWQAGLRPRMGAGRVTGVVGALGACGLAVWLVPAAWRLAGAPSHVPLLNTYTALIMPGLANGFSIFLIKGFFDGLPRELYEAAQIDGASELRMFRVVTYPLAKPIIVYTVIGMALGAYGGFMWAFVVVPDERMWTLMVWLYQFSTDYAAHRMSLVMAALVVASIPTLLFFAFCQRIILRGIILPVMK